MDLETVCVRVCVMHMKKGSVLYVPVYFLLAPLVTGD